MIKRDVYLASRDLGKTTDTSSRPSQAAIEHNLRAIAEAHGTDSEQYKNYLSHIGVPDLGEETYVLSDNTGQVLSEGFGEMTLPEINGTSMERITLDQRGAFTFSFSITEEKMVNVWTKGMGMRNVDLEITGDNLEQKYASDKMGPAGESISIKLTPGHYAVIVKDATNYNGGSMATGDFPVDVHYSMETYNSTEISGRISIPERSDTMPVRMRVAEFDGDTRNINYDRSPSDGGVNKLDPSKPVWIVIHGMNSSEDSPVIKDLAAAFGQHANTHDFQVVTLDWNEAAKDGVFIQDAPWTVAVGKWAAHQLQSIGFEAGQINVAGWSHGSYVAYEMGAELQRNTSSTLNTLIALDAATNIPAFSQYNHEPVDFSAISKHSLALDSSIVAGSNTLASTADVAFKIRSDHTTTTTTRHRHAVSVLSSILNGSGAASTEFTQKLGIETLLSGSFVNEYEKDIFGDVFEGVIDVQMSTENPDNATPTRMILDINDL